MFISQEIYSKAINNYIKNFKFNKSKVDIVVLPTKDTLILPNEAYNKDEVIHVSFGAEETLTANQIKTKDNTFKCVIFYKRI